MEVLRLSYSEKEDAWQPAADWHTHSIYSDGFGTVMDIAQAAVDAGLYSVAVTEHGPAAATAGVWRQQTLLLLSDDAHRASESENIQVLCGVEANVVNKKGDIDVSPEVYKSLDVLAVGLHRGLTVWQGISSRSSVAGNTEALLACLYKHPVDVVTHPGHLFGVEPEELARGAENTHTALEINSRHGSAGVDFLRRAAQYDIEFWCGSDAHLPSRVGDVQNGLQTALKAGLMPCRIRNTVAGFEHL